MNTNIWLSMGGAAAVLSMLGGLGIWALRMVVRDEIRPVVGEVGEIKARVGRLEEEILAMRERT